MYTFALLVKDKDGIVFHELHTRDSCRDAEVGHTRTDGDMVVGIVNMAYLIPIVRIIGDMGKKYFGKQENKQDGNG